MDTIRRVELHADGTDGELDYYAGSVTFAFSLTDGNPDTGATFEYKLFAPSGEEVDLTGIGLANANELLAGSGIYKIMFTNGGVHLLTSTNHGWCYTFMCRTTSALSSGWQAIEIVPVASSAATAAADIKNIVTAQKVMVKDGSAWMLSLYPSGSVWTESSPILTRHLTDKTGAEVTDLAVGAIAMEVNV